MTLEPIYTWNLVLFHQQVNLTFRRGLNNIKIKQMQHQLALIKTEPLLLKSYFDNSSFHSPPLNLPKKKSLHSMSSSKSIYLIKPLPIWNTLCRTRSGNSYIISLRCENIFCMDQAYHRLINRSLGNNLIGMGSQLKLSLPLQIPFGRFSLRH